MNWKSCDVVKLCPVLCQVQCTVSAICDVSEILNPRIIYRQLLLLPQLRDANCI